MSAERWRRRPRPWRRWHPRPPVESVDRAGGSQSIEAGFQQVTGDGYPLTGRELGTRVEIGTSGGVARAFFSNVRACVQRLYLSPTPVAVQAPAIEAGFQLTGPVASMSSSSMSVTSRWASIAAFGSPVLTFVAPRAWRGARCAARVGRHRAMPAWRHPSWCHRSSRTTTCGVPRPRPHRAHAVENPTIWPARFFGE